MVKTVEHTVAAVLDGGGGVAGTAFLFRREEGGCYWFTCHHVIAELESLRLGINFKSAVAGNVIEAEYVAAASATTKDIAVLRTDSAAALAEFAPLPMGDALVGAAFSETAQATGIGFTPSNVKGFQNGRDFTMTLRRGQAPELVVHPEDVSEKIAALSHPWNIPNPYAECRVFNLAGSDVPLDGGLSGSPICITTKNSTLLCVGMLSQSSTRMPGNGLAIRYEELFSAAGTLIPFYPYADCVILVIAAKLDEITPHVSDAHVLKDSNLCTIYSERDRNGWKCIDNKNIMELLHGKQKPYRTWQIATVYLEDLREMDSFLRDAAGPLFYIIDGCSLSVPELKPVVEEADRHYFHAAYLFPRHEARVTNADLERFKEEAMPHVYGQRWIRLRVKECTVRDDFEEKFWALLEKAVEFSARLMPEGEMDRLLTEAGIPRGVLNRLPIPSSQNAK